MKVFCNAQIKPVKLFIPFLFFLAVTGCKNKQDKTASDNKIDTVEKTVKSNVNEVADSVPIKKNQPDNSGQGEEVKVNEEFIQKAVIDRKDSSITVYQNIRADYRVFCYQSPDTTSKKMLLFSVFTSDVKDNPYHCVYGSYYYSGAMPDMTMKYVKKTGHFIEAQLLRENELVAPIYIRKEWVEFEN